MIQRGDARANERLEIDVRTHLFGEGLYDRMLDRVCQAIELEHVLDLRLRAEIFGRTGVCAS